ncbi:hypothetical protein [Chlorobium limicola]|nr:hypothetical protein [Chlorobium limicola]
MKYNIVDIDRELSGTHAETAFRIGTLRRIRAKNQNACPLL